MTDSTARDISWWTTEAVSYTHLYSLGQAGIEFLLPEPVTVPGTEIPVFSCVLLVLAVMFGIMASVRRSLTKKRERHRARRREEKRAVLNYDDIQTYEDVSHEFMGTDITDEIKAVSYTHLDVYKRQAPEISRLKQNRRQTVLEHRQAQTHLLSSRQRQTEKYGNVHSCLLYTSRCV